MPSIIEKPEVVIEKSLLHALQQYTATESQVVIHGIISPKDEMCYIRVWPTTFLFDKHSSHVSELVYFEKISGYPIWTQIQPNKQFHFTLIFTGLPKACSAFDLHEVIPEFSGFYIPDIVRNERDVYFVDFTES